MALSEYDKQFAEAMAVKLKLNRQQNSKTSTSQTGPPGRTFEGRAG